VPPLCDLAFSVVVTIITVITVIATLSVADNNDTVVESAIALRFLQDAAFVKLEVAR